MLLVPNNFSQDLSEKIYNFRGCFKISQPIMKKFAIIHFQHFNESESLLKCQNTFFKRH